MKNTLKHSIYTLLLCSVYTLPVQAEIASYEMPNKNMHCTQDINGKINCELADEMTSGMVKCVNKDKRVYCTNQNDEPVTGEVVKYENGVIRRRYAFKDGYLDGVGKAYDKYGYATTEITYKEGVLSGNINTYGRNGQRLSQIPYTEGKKEGIAEYSTNDITVKTIYIDDSLNGTSQIWHNKTKKKIYDLEMSSDYLASMTYYYYSNPDETCCDYIGQENFDTDNLIEKNVKAPKILIDAVNVGCAETHDKFSCSPYPVVLKPAEEGCKEWIKNNQNELKAVQQQFKCK